MTMELGTMNAEELDCSHRLEWEYHEALRQGKNVPPPPTDVRLTLKRWLEAVEEFVQAYPGAIVLSADRADYRMLGMVAYTQDETHVLNVYLPISVLHPNPRSPWNRALRRRDFAENLRQGEVLSVELGPGHQLPVKERVFPETPADASKRHVVLLQPLSTNMDMLERLIQESRSPGGQTFELATVRMDEDQPPTEGL